MKKALLLLIASFFSFTMTYSQFYEDFEGGAKQTWNPINGVTYEAVANPGKDAVNDSDNVGKLVNSATSDFNFIICDLPAPADLSKNNLLKMKVWTPIPTRVLFKMEGGGKAVEKFLDLNITNQWVEMSFDLSAGSEFTTLSKILIAINPFVTPVEETFYFDDIRGVEAKDWYETFETGNEMGWQGLDGTLEAPVANPAPNKVNDSANCGKYTKSGTHAYSLLLADRGTTPFDLSVNNQFKVSIHASAPTKVLFKLEGGGGPAIEKTANIGLANAWQEYTFDFSAAKDYTNLTKAILFFDYGEETSTDVYHFDNIYAVPQGACAGVTPDPLVVDDFECNRNATYVNGWDSLSVIANPAPNGVNNSKSVGRYADPVGEPYGALVIDYQDPINLSTNNQLNVKMWSSKAVPVLFKLEAGASPAKEIWTNITEVNQWVDYTIDFSDQALASHKKLVIFFNAGVDGAAGDVYYFDNLSWGVKTVTDIENFENGAFLPWEPLDQLTAIHGEFEVVDNPSETEPNTSAKVGKYTKGSSGFSTLSAVAPGIIDISEKPQYNLDIWAPVGSDKIIMQLESPTEGLKEVERNITNAGNWETVNFDFTNFQDISDWVSMRLQFNPGIEEPGTVYYFDNLRQSEATVDPCEGTVAVTNVINDFECQQNYEFGAGAQLVTIVNNPTTSTVNSSTKAGLYKDPANEPWAALCAEIPDGINLDAFNQLSLQVLSTKANVPVLLKLEGGSSPAKEIWTEITTANEWVNVSADFSGEKGNNHKRACFFFNGGVETSAVEDYYIDNLQFAHAPYNSCLINFDDPAFVSTTWKYFPSDDSGDFELVDNPAPNDVNKSAKVGKAVEKSTSGQPWQGMYTDLASHIVLGANKVIRMKVLSPQVGAVTMKLENPKKAGAPTSGDNTIQNTKAGEWEELAWDFSTTPIVDDGEYRRITLIWDILNIPSADVIYYFDDIKIDGTSCGESVSTNDTDLESLAIAPNPVRDLLQIKNTQGVSSFKITNIFGQNIASVSNNGNSEVAFDVSAFQPGTFIITSLDKLSHPVGIAKFIKI